MADDGILGPKYNFSDQLTAPSELGITRSGSIEGVLRAAAGINYYSDAIGFGESTLLAREMGMNQSPLGLRFFVATGQFCSNGADMYEYVSTIPTGNLGKISETVENTMGVKLRGMAPGILEDATGAMNPLPMFKAVIGSGYAKCKKVTLPVGDENGRISSPFDASDIWIKNPIVYKSTPSGSRPHQTRWVLDSYITADEYNATPKTEKPDVFPTEGFQNVVRARPESSVSPQIAAGLLCTLLVFGIVCTVKKN